MKSITEEVQIVAVIGDKAPAWAVGLIGRLNPWLLFVDLCNPETSHHQLFPAEAFIFVFTETGTGTASCSYEAKD